MLLRCTRKGSKYRRYELFGHKIYGICVIEKYNTGWHLELMNVTPQRQGYGSLLLRHVRKNIGQSMTVCPVTNESRAFFVKHGMTNKYVLE